VRRQAVDGAAHGAAFVIGHTSSSGSRSR
jgi:hypothetical protein